MSPEKPDALLWMDVETTGLDTNRCSILEIGLRCTSMDATREHARLEAIIHISRETMLAAQLPALDLHLNNGLLAQCETSDPSTAHPRQSHGKPQGSSGTWPACTPCIPQARTSNTSICP